MFTLDCQSQLSAPERAELEAIGQFLRTEVSPVVAEYWEKEEFPFALLPKLAQQGLGRLHESEHSRLFIGLVHAEIARCDVSLSTFIGVHSELVGGVVTGLCSEQQKSSLLPPMRDFQQMGCFALTEPDHGSDISGGLATTARFTDDGWVLNGEKRWIGNGTFATFAIVFARDVADGQVKGFVVREGFGREKISGKMSVRIVQNANLTFTDTPAELIPGAESFANVNTYLCSSRAWVGWQAVGAQLGIMDLALHYARERQQFGRPIAKFQLVQEALAKIAGNVAASISLMSQVASMQQAGTLGMEHAALAKATTTRLARESAAAGRAIAGGNGIVAEYGLGKMFADVEALYTYEGTYEINSLIVGRALTGMSAFV
ncbi:acyl-CoA dehydrogenase family protein [Corynebacterium felinum]|nr:acyl-CoA dehydrogenase family protein [Corynebacterium felinum]MDF5820400.1 acyl-CoA dehydrogenase family protein [Corynebacterium felinum]